MNVPATSAVEELQVFLIELKSKTIPLKALSIIDKTIPYPILFVLTCGDDICYVIQHKLESRRRYYKKQNGISYQHFRSRAQIEAVYQLGIVTSFIALG